MELRNKKILEPLVFFGTF